jgi:hypothetical protein
MSIFDTAFCSLHAAFVAADAGVVSFEFDGVEIADALSSGINHEHQDIEEGLYAQAGGTVKYRLADEPEAWRANDHIVGRSATLEETPVRVVSRAESGGIVTLQIISRDGKR